MSTYSRYAEKFAHSRYGDTWVANAPKALRPAKMIMHVNHNVFKNPFVTPEDKVILKGIKRDATKGKLKTIVRLTT